MKPTIFLRRREVEAVTGLPRATLYLAIQKGDFPRPYRIGLRAVAWRQDEIAEWQSGRTRTLQAN